MPADQKLRYRIELRNSAGVTDCIQETFEQCIAIELEWQKLCAGDAIAIIANEEE